MTYGEFRKIMDKELPNKVTSCFEGSGVYEFTYTPPRSSIAQQAELKQAIKDFVKNHNGTIQSHENYHVVVAKFNIDGIPESHMTYKDFPKVFIGDSDIASLTVRTPHAVHMLDFGGDSAYFAYVCEDVVDIAPHYTPVFEGEHWFKIYDDSGLVLTQYSHDAYTKFTFYRSGEYGCIIHWHE